MRSLPLLVLILVALAPPADALSLAAEGDAGALLVGYEPGQADAVTAALEALGATVSPGSDALDFLVAQPPDTLDALALIEAVEGVSYVEPDDAIGATGAQWNGAEWNGAQWNGAEWNGVEWNGKPADGSEDPGRAGQWALEAVRAPAAWEMTKGQGRASLCVIDSGVSSGHPDLKTNFRGAYDATLRGDTSDSAGHGTHMAGVAAAVVGNGFGTAGMGNVGILSARVFDAAGNGRESALARGIAWCADQGADVALMALSADNKGPTLDRALSYAASRDVLLVASAGNSGCGGCVAYPASDPRVVAVSAIGESGSVAGFSATGPEVELAAPGERILAPFPDDRFVYGSGTSQAAAHVAGVAALLRDADPGLDAAAARAVLAKTAADEGSGGRDSGYGHGVVDAEAALREAST